MYIVNRQAARNAFFYSIEVTNILYGLINIHILIEILRVWSC